MRRLLLLVPVLAAAYGCGFPKSTPKPTKPSAEKIDDRNTNYRADGSTLGNAARAGKRVVQLNDFNGLRTFILTYEIENNRMPTIDQIKADLKNYPDASEILKKVEEGVIILTGTTDKNALWAYEIDADKAGGIVLVGPSGEIKRVSADEAKQLIGKK